MNLCRIAAIRIIAFTISGMVTEFVVSLSKIVDIFVMSKIGFWGLIQTEVVVLKSANRTAGPRVLKAATKAFYNPFKLVCVCPSCLIDVAV